MKKKYLLICNPKAGNRHAKTIRLLTRLLSVKHIDHRFFFTEYPGHATQIANNEARRYDVIVVVGGDGTLNEVINARNAQQKVIGLIPAGSGNDFARSCGIPTNNVRQALDIVLENKSQLIDLGSVNDHYFINGVGVGFAATATATANKFQFMPTPVQYYCSILYTLLMYKPILLTVEMNEKKYTQSTLLLNISKGCYQAGGVAIAPDASLTDGLFSIMHCQQCSLFQRFLGLYRLLKGRPRGMPSTSLMKSSSLRLSSHHDIFLQQDGNCMMLGKEISLEIKPKALRFIGCWGAG